MNWKLSWALLKKQGDGLLSRLGWERRLFEKQSMGPGQPGVKFNTDLELLIWKERQGYFQTVLNLEVLEPASGTGQGWDELWPTATGPKIKEKLSQVPGTSQGFSELTRKTFPATCLLLLPSHPLIQWGGLAPFLLWDSLVVLGNSCLSSSKVLERTRTLKSDKSRSGVLAVQFISLSLN